LIVANAQTGSERKTWTPPVTAWGHTDLQGVWTTNNTTPLERPKDLEGQSVLTGEALKKREGLRKEELNIDRLKGVGAYNEYWIERGPLLAQTSLVVDPPDGKMPPFTEAGRQRWEAGVAARRTRPADSWEDRAPSDRCITRGMPGTMVPTSYNNTYQIFQTPQFVAIVSEMIHDTRLIPIDGRPHLNRVVEQWLGDSRGHWEGQTLVVETTNINDKVFGRSPDNFYFGVGRDLRLIERFTRAGPDTIDYQFTVNAPTVYTRPWTVAMPMMRSASPMYEYACHEGNLSMIGILSGARADEKKGSK